MNKFKNHRSKQQTNNSIEKETKCSSKNLLSSQLCLYSLHLSLLLPETVVRADKAAIREAKAATVGAVEMAVVGVMGAQAEMVDMEVQVAGMAVTAAILNN